MTSPIIDIAICIDNQDPKGIGRIRCVRYSERVSELEKALKYEAFSDTDPFVAIPFLPYNINFIPEIDQTVKIINYNPDKEHVNKEYIAGPFTTLHDFNSQKFSQQVENTTYGVILKESPNVFDKNGNYLTGTENAFAKKTDYGIYGKYGSDILFTENGIQLRGGKLYTKESLSAQSKDKMIKLPLMGKKNASLHLKKFAKKMTLETNTSEETYFDIKDVKTIVEYEIDDLNNPSKIDFYVYNVINNGGSVTKTNFFNETIDLPSSVLKLINVDKSTTGITHTISVDSENIDYIGNTVRDFIYTIRENGLSAVNPLYNSDDLHPIYFRPSKYFINLSGTTQDIQFRNTILSKVKISTAGPRSGLIFSLLNINPPQKKRKVKKQVLKTNQTSSEQTFSALKSDKVYLLSTDTNETDKAIDFTTLDKYDYTQEDYIQRIDPYTFASVRGENLIKLLQSIIRVLFNHRHNINKPMVKIGYDEYDQLVKLIETMENDILNKSVRIN